MRHGDAPYINGERQISEQGHDDVRSMASWLGQELKQYKIKLDAILASPILRAQQTADTVEDCLSERLDYSWTRQTEPLLKSEADPSITIPFIEEVTSGNLLLISHMPLVSHLWAGWLNGASQYFPTSAIGCITINDDKKAEKLIFQSLNSLEF
jgi:phosphohistidine phosphatase